MFGPHPHLEMNIFDRYRDTNKGTAVHLYGTVAVTGHGTQTLAS